MSGSVTHRHGVYSGVSTGMSMPNIASGGPRNSKPGTLNQLFLDAVAKYGSRTRCRSKRNGRYEPISHDTLAERVRRAALGLEELGVRSGDRVAILSENRPEWAIADYACLTIGAADVPIYPNLPGDQIAYILRDSGRGRDLRVERRAGGEGRVDSRASARRCGT